MDVFQLAREFLAAMAEGREESYLAAHHQILHEKSSVGETVLHFLTIENQPKAVRFLASHGAEVDSRNDSGNTPLFDAVTLGYREMVRLLLDLGADATRRNKADEAILHLWIRSPDPDILRWLVEAGADLEAVCGVGKTPLQEAVSSHVYSSSTWEQVLPEQFREQLRLVREQAEKLAPGRRDPGKFLRAVEHLAASGADLNAPGRFETAPYLVALEAGDEEMVQLLRRLGAQEG